jgi:photosystem II stability/assembly factor-like uncharacterized protein
MEGNMRTMLFGRVAVCLCLGIWALAEVSDRGINDGVLNNLEWRCIGPAVMGGRATDVEGVPGNPRVVYVGSASGGVWKTVDGGITWKPLFDEQPVLSIGDLALEPGNPEVIYAGTGESNLRNSISFGNGVYKSTDGGMTWKHLGLEKTRHISRILINPLNTNILYVAAVGHCFGPNPERGVFRSSDGGQSWKKILYIDEFHGASDLEIDPKNPNILYAGMWNFERKPWTFTSGSKEGGVYKTVDGGLTWVKLRKGLPDLMGRIGVKVAPSDPRIVYVIPEAKEGSLYKSENYGEKFELVSTDNRLISRGFYYADMRVDPRDENRVYALGIWLYRSIDGGKTFEQIARGLHSDYHALWIDPQNPDRIWEANDGGVAVSYNRGETWEYIDLLCFSQFYQIYADNREPFYCVGGGLQDNRTWYAPSRTREPYGILNDDWRMVSSGDGFHVVVHPDNPDLFLSESQGGRLMRTDMKTREQQIVAPYPLNPFGASAGEQKYRFNWNAPIVTSPHAPHVIYFGGNVVFKSDDFGTNWKIISPDLTTNDPIKQKSAGGPVWEENTTAEYHCTIISLAESPVQPGLLWAGTDDGNLQISRDGGANWENVKDNVKGLQLFSSVSHLEPSHTAAGTCYVSFDRHMLDDFMPYLYKTSDFGQSWSNIGASLPENAYVWVVREDPRNSHILYAGTEIGPYISPDIGEKWERFHLKNYPNVAVHDILIHPRANDLILGTHGRGIWILDDITPIQALTQTILTRPAFLFDMRPAIRFSMRESRTDIGNKEFRGVNPPYGTLITYYLKERPEKDSTVKIEILDAEGTVIRELSDIPKDPGLNRTSWDLRQKGPQPRRYEEEESTGTPSRRGGSVGPRVIPGNYTVRLTKGTEMYEKPVKVLLDPALSVTHEELEEQSVFVLEIQDMLSGINKTLRELDCLADQIQERVKTALSQKAEDKESLQKGLSEHRAKIGELETRMVRPPLKVWPPIDQPPRLSEKLSDLFNQVEGTNAAPTPSQKEMLAELKSEYGQILSAVNDYLLHTATGINTLLQKHRLPKVLIPGPISVK